jgi:hypothetical protein
LRAATLAASQVGETNPAEVLYPRAHKGFNAKQRVPRDELRREIDELS